MFLKPDRQQGLVVRPNQMLFLFQGHPLMPMWLACFGVRVQRDIVGHCKWANNSRGPFLHLVHRWRMSCWSMTLFVSAGPLFLSEWEKQPPAQEMSFPYSSRGHLAIVNKRIQQALRTGICLMDVTGVWFSIFLVFQVPGLFQIVAYPVSSTIPLMWWSGWAVQPRYPAGQRATLSPPFSGSEMANHLIQTRWMRSHSLSFYQKEVCSSSASSPAERVSPMKQCMPALLGTAPGLRPAETPLFT